MDSYARITTRLTALLEALGLAAGGEQGARLAQRCGIQTSSTTLLRRLLCLAAVPLPPVRVLGVDDWSWKKGQRYGTILVDLERRKIIDLLPDRTSATCAAWLRQHPEVQIISRERGTDYAAAVREAAPQARPIADRFHLVRNVAAILLPCLARWRAELCASARREAPEPEPSPPDPPRSLPHPDTWRQHAPAQVERKYQAKQAEREELFAQMATLHAAQVPLAEIGKRLGKSDHTVRLWLKRGSAPVQRRCRKRHSIFDPYADYVLERWQAGVHDGPQLFAEIRAQGFSGSVSGVQRFLQTLRTRRRPLIDLAPPSPAEQLSARAALWLFIREPTTLTDREQATLEAIRQASVTADTAYGLVQGFLTMVRQREGERLDAWIEAAQASQIPELQRLVLGILRDKEAVQAGLTEEYSNGPVEAQVQKLKVVKRAMFGRAKLPLLKQRLLHTVLRATPFGTWPFRRCCLLSSCLVLCFCVETPFPRIKQTASLNVGKAQIS